jgi:hypothetical protein
VSGSRTWRGAACFHVSQSQHVIGRDTPGLEARAKAAPLQLSTQRTASPGSWLLLWMSGANSYRAGITTGPATSIEYGSHAYH